MTLQSGSEQKLIMFSGTVQCSPYRIRSRTIKDRAHGTSRFPWWLNDKESTCQYKRHRFEPWVQKIPWSGKQQSTPVVLPGKSHRQRSLVGYSSWGCKELDTTEHQHAYVTITYYQSLQIAYLPLPLLRHVHICLWLLR